MSNRTQYIHISSSCRVLSMSAPHTVSDRFLRTDLAISVYDILGGCQSQKSHGASRVELLCADADLRAVSELEAVGESCGSVHIYGSRVHFVQELLSVLITVGNDGFGMAGIITVDVFNSLVYRIHHFNGKYVIQIFRSPVFLCGGNSSRHQGKSLLVRTHLHVLFFQALCQHGEELILHGVMYQKRFAGVAHAYSR